ncbi:methylenetetrahydrofolate reductase [Paenibacillus sp. NPDC058071]|uniref:methylenetetrahydrofolate reductase n=1 Tax=Paenibacillus sp. NPDC058071 TaxID=3346326 RepID=UPI0036D82F4A
MLKQKIASRTSGILTYGITPPKKSHTPEKTAEIAQKQIDRLRSLDLDGLILYDVQEEDARTGDERPFPYLETMDPGEFSRQYLSGLAVPKIIYRCVGNNTEQELSDWVHSDNEQDRFSVFVGASSSKQQVKLDLLDAYSIASKQTSNLMLGGVVIPERHMKKNDEHLRVAAKTAGGCNFFISQATYNIESSKNFLSDYYYHCQSNGLEMVPILFNLAPCGSQKTLEFMKWLGISIPKWLENDLVNSNDILDKSINLSKKIFEELFEFGVEKGIPIGCSVESVSTRKVEIDASIQLTKDIRAVMDKRMPSVAIR